MTFFDNENYEIVKFKLVFWFITIIIALIVVFINAFAILLIKNRKWNEGSLIIHSIVVFFYMINFYC